MKIAAVLAKIKSFASKTAGKLTMWGLSLWRLLSFNLADQRIAPGRCLAVELSTGHISVVYASRFLSRMKIRGIRDYLFEKGKIPTPENLASAILLAINDLHAQQTPITLVVPKIWAIMKTTEFPLTVADNLSAVVSYELDRLTPLTADSSFYDFRIIAKDESRLKIILFAMNVDIFQPYLTALKERNVHVERVTVSTSAFATISHYVERRGSTVFITTDTAGYEAVVVSNGQLQCTLGGDFPEGDELSGELIIAGAINPLIDTLKKEGKSLNVILHHLSSEYRYSRLRDMIRIPSRSIRKIDSGIHYSEAVNPQMVSYAAMGGAWESLWPAASGMNLLDRGIHRSLSPPVFPSIILLFVLAALGLFWILSPLQLEEKKLEAIDREIAVRKDEVRKVEALKKDVENLDKEIAAIGSFKASRPLSLIILKETTLLLPKKAWLSRLRIAESLVEIEGYATSATELLPKLEASPYFRKVDFASPTFKDTRMNADRFTIKMEIEGLAEERTKYEKQK